MNKKKEIRKELKKYLDSKLEKCDLYIFDEVVNFIKKDRQKQLILSGVGSSNDKKDQIINKEYIIVDSKDGLWDVYDTNGCLGTGLNNEEVNRVTRKRRCLCFTT
tara:strand:- start:124 stop:438 length:315 start_codon:yes stop_codon:yes gene_type:complete